LASGVSPSNFGSVTSVTTMTKRSVALSPSTLAGEPFGSLNAASVTFTGRKPAARPRDMSAALSTASRSRWRPAPAACRP